MGVVLLALPVLLLVAVVAARIYFEHYLHSEAFRKSLGEAAAKSLNADSATFAPLEFDGGTVFGENFQATRGDGGAFSSLDADQLRASFDWHGLLRHTVQIDEMSVQRLNIEPPAAAAVEAHTAQSLSGAGPAAQGPLDGLKKGWTVDLRKAVISEANWQWSDKPGGGITGTALTLIPNGPGAWIIDAQGGTVALAGWPELDLDTASMRWQSPTLFINSAGLRNGASRLTVTGEIETRKAANLQVKFDGVDIRPLLTPDWRERLTGRLTGQANVDAPLGNGNAARQLTVSGSMALTEGVLTALPILDEIGTFTHTERFRRLELTKASADFTKSPDRLEVHNLVVESEGLIRVEGDYTVVNGQIDGNFEVGLTPATLQWIPGSQEVIFTDSHGGYRWTPMRLTGPVAHPHDDLTSRLVAATEKAVIKSVDGVEGTVKKTGQGLLDLLMH